MILWTRMINLAYANMIPASLVGCASRKATLSTTPARDVGISHLTCWHSPARFSYIPASGGSGMQISPIDTVIKQPLRCGAYAGLARGKSSKRPQAENSTGIRPTDGSMANPS